MEQVRPRFLRVTPTGQGLAVSAPGRCRLTLFCPLSQAPPTDFDEVMGTYDKLFIQYGEALGAIAAEMEVGPEASAPRAVSPPSLQLNTQMHDHVAFSSSPRP